MDHDSGAGAATAGGPLPDAGSDHDLRLAIASAANAAPARAQIRRWLRQRLPADRVDEFLLACGEAVDNALEHGSSPITLELSWSGVDESRSLTVVIRDSGTWRVAATGAERGMGIPIMMALMDSLTIDTTDGTTVRLSRRF